MYGNVTRISRKLVAHSVAAALGLGVALSIVQIVIDYRSELASAEHLLERVLNVAAPTAAQAVYVLDDAVARVVVEGLLSYEFIIEASIVDELGERLASATDGETTDGEGPLLGWLLPGIAVHEMPLVRTADPHSPYGRLVVVVDHSLALAGFVDRSAFVLVAGIVRNMLLAVVLLVIFHRLLTRPLLRLARAVEEVRPEAPWCANLPEDLVARTDDLGRLTRRVKHFLEVSAKDLRHRDEAEAALRTGEERVRGIVDHLPIGLCLEDCDGTFLLVNPTFARWQRHPPEAILGERRTVAFPLRLPPDATEWRVAAETRVFGEGAVLARIETLTTPDGIERSIEVTKFPVRDAEGAVVAVGTAVVDVSERHAAEQALRKLTAELEHRVAERTANLEAVNRELETITHSVSHDLRAPIRHVGGFAKLLEDALDEVPDPTVAHYVENIQRAAKHMGELIDDLLDFSRTGRAVMREERVDLDKLVARLVEGYAPDTVNRDVRFEVSQLGHVRGDPHLLARIFGNLISNALKFTRDRESAHVRVERAPQTRDGRAVFSVADNGVGFDPAYARKLFGVFERLHMDSEYEGTGIGLAIVRRIVERHGGEAWAESSGDGATFSFSLRAA